MKVIQLRGANGCGKTTIIRQYSMKYGFKIKEVVICGIKTFLCVSPGNRIVVLGRYDKNISGCDCFRNKYHVMNTLIFVMERIKPEYIIFEGLIYGTTFKFASEVEEISRIHGYEYKGICLFLDVKESYRRVLMRNGGKPFNYERLETKIKQNVRAYNSLKEAGYNVELIEVKNLGKKEMVEILEKEIQ